MSIDNHTGFTPERYKEIETRRLHHERGRLFHFVPHLFERGMSQFAYDRLLNELLDTTVTVHGEVFTPRRSFPSGTFGLVLEATSPLREKPVVLKLSTVFDRSVLRAPGGFLPETLPPTVGLRARSALSEATALRAVNTIPGCRDFFPSFYGAELLRTPNYSMKKNAPDQRICAQVMEHVEGDSLRQWMSQVDLTQYPDFLLHCVNNIAHAVRTLHRNHMVHADIKPDNIILRETTKTPVLIDFGGCIFEDAFFEQRNRPRPFWAPSRSLGTEFYAPVQERGSADRTRDVYALGVTIQEMLFGDVLATDAEAETMYTQRYSALDPRLQRLASQALLMTHANPHRRPTMEDVSEFMPLLFPPYTPAKT